MNKTGDLEVYAIRNGFKETYPVDSIVDAKNLIDRLTANDLKNDDIIWNVFGLLIYSPDDLDANEDGFIEWFNEDGYDFCEAIDNGSIE